MKRFNLYEESNKEELVGTILLGHVEEMRPVYKSLRRAYLKDRIDGYVPPISRVPYEGGILIDRKRWNGSYQIVSAETFTAWCCDGLVEAI